VEGADNKGQAWNILMPDNTSFVSSFQKDLLNGVVTVQAEVPVVTIAADGFSVASGLQKVSAIPYYAWCNREPGPMQVWLPRKIKNIKLNY
jgi:DUF1680 family protein